MRSAAAAKILAGVAAASLAVAQASAADAEYRKDVFLPFDEYAEPAPSPLTGGRVFVVGTALASGMPGSIYVNNQLVNLTLGQNESTWPIDFLHVQPAPLVEAAPFFAVFHSRQAVWDSISQGSIRITDASGTILINSTFPVSSRHQARVSYLTTAQQGEQVIVHVLSNSTTTLTNPKLLINGAPASPPATGPYARAFPSQLLPGETIMFVAASPVAGGLAPGSALTARVQFDDGTVAVAGIRRQKEFFPMETWPKSSECPYPTVNDTNYRIHRDHGVDTFFTTDGSTSKCANPISEEDIINTLAPEHDFWVLGGKDINTSLITNSSRLAGWFLGDEDDNHATITDNLRQNAADSKALWASFPDTPTYVGGSRNRYRGAWANSVDALGMDFYIAACAPHVTNWGLPFHLRGSYDYLRTTRDNQMPWPTWLYSQVFDSGWNANIFGTVVVRQPDPAELAVSMQSVVAAGGKGMMMFQTEIGLNASIPDSWAELGVLGREIGAARELYRQGDLVLGVDTGGDNASIVSLIQAPRALVLTLINIHNNGGYDDLTCGIGGDDHWKMLQHSVPVSFQVPSGWADPDATATPFADTFELSGGQVVPPAAVGSEAGGGTSPWRVSTSSVALDASAPSVTRTVIFARDAQLRGEIAQALKPWSTN
jgi:hypothetical protein